MINLTQHSATPAQIEAGVVDLPAPELARLRELLTFAELPSPAEITERAERLAVLAIGPAGDRACRAMVGGAPYLMAPLERALRARGVTPLYAYSRRESVESTLPDGSVKKSQIFRHLGFVPAVMS